MQKLTRIITLSVSIAVISGCSYVGVYKRDIPQGNLVTEEMVDQLQPGMTQEQVTYVMGRPLLEAPFDARQWDYIFRLDKAYSDVEKRRVTLTFDNQGRLADIDQEGDLSEDIPLEGEDVRGPATDTADPSQTNSEQSQNPAPSSSPSSQP
ncbi:outer membrane protein assembly factor BamE [Halomonas sp. hl-4]|uniref:outer membrane protein assembly factor BamE n=1 Tax=Halomonas sp. hl-4 TaxID=1761789 RepID=UPI000BB89278|nr:outer membrane protein assembly factor BamE [Halomonas sp. hl-4]SNY97578.1 Beta-barrel assembly machine subunit BamE [Halomonas sp. hl-4]